MIVSVIDPQGCSKVAQKRKDLMASFQFWYGSKTQAGFNTHGPNILKKAFKGLNFLEKESRPFKRGELKLWILPEERLRWLVYQKPQC